MKLSRRRSLALFAAVPLTLAVTGQAVAHADAAPAPAAHSLAAAATSATTARPVSVSASSPYSNIKALQHLLTAYGITTDTDGSYGPATTASVKTFQKLKNLSQTGQADTATMTAMTGGANVAVKTGWPNHDTVKAAQQLLVKLGYKATVNGTFDANDTALIKSFQTSHKITATGTVDAATWKKLFVPTAS